MAGKQAKVLTSGQFRMAMIEAGRRRFADRNRAMLLLSVKAGLRAGEIAKLTWEMVETADGKLANVIELQNKAAKKGSGRTIPMHPELKAVLTRLQRKRRFGGGKAPVIESERGAYPMKASSVVNWFYSFYAALDFEGCSSHSGRRTFITRAARLVSKAGGSLRDVQQLAGHRSIEQTQGYIDGDTNAKRRLVALL
jgi:integrase